MSDDPVIPYKLYGSDWRALVCRFDADPGFEGCSKIRVIVNGRSSYLCPPRVYAFLGKDAVSLAGLGCQRPVDPGVARDRVPD